jgi:hypothetical protein
LTRTCPGPAAEGVLATRRRQWHSHTLRPRGVPSASHQASHRHSGTSDRKQSASQGSTVPSGHSSGGHAQEGECWAKSNGPSGCATPLSGTGSHGTRGKDHAASATSSDVAMTSSGQSPSMMMVTIMRCRIVCFLRFQADSVIRSARGTDQYLVSTVGTKDETDGRARGGPPETHIHLSLSHVPCHISNRPGTPQGGLQQAMKSMR